MSVIQKKKLFREVEEVLAYAEKHISHDEQLTPDQLDRLEKTFALLAFDDPLESPFASILSPEHRKQAYICIFRIKNEFLDIY